MLGVLICEVAVIQNYLSLCYGRANWWWRSFIYGASISGWLFLVLTYHLAVDLRVQHVTTVLVYMMIQVVVCVLGGLSAGSLSVVANFVFNSLIFRKVR